MALKKWACEPPTAAQGTAAVVPLRAALDGKLLGLAEPLMHQVGCPRTGTAEATMGIIHVCKRNCARGQHFVSSIRVRLVLEIASRTGMI